MFDCTLFEPDQWRISPPAAAANERSLQVRATLLAAFVWVDKGNTVADRILLCIAQLLINPSKITDIWEELPKSGGEMRLLRGQLTEAELF